jgi:hypothetical protein
VSEPFADRPKKYCIEQGCPNLISYGAGPRCPDCEKKSASMHNRRPMKLALYNRTDWKRLREQLTSMGNSICQRVSASDWVRCRNVAYAWHHIIEAEENNSELWYDWRNLVAVCHSCHPRRMDEDQGAFVPTIYRTPFSNDPVPEALGAPGAVLTAEQMAKLWTKAERVAYFGARSGQ